MMARRSVIGILAGGIMAVLSGCNPFGGNSYRFKMTVEVDTPQGVRTGSSVYEVNVQKDIKLTAEMSNSQTSIRGEAVAIDIAPGRTLFALLKTVGVSGADSLSYMSMKTMDPGYNNNALDSAARIAAGDGIRSPAEVAPSDYPMLVTFTDMADPKSVTKVDPADLAAAFGPGVKLRRITVAVTQEAVTSGIGKRLAWVFDTFYFDKMLDGQTTNDGSSLANNLTPSSFSAGIKP